MFTDYINVLITDSDVGSLQNKIDSVTAELETWFNRNDLVINAGKTGVMSFHSRQTNFLVKSQVTFNKMNLDCTAEMKFRVHPCNRGIKMELPCTVINK
jgi:hypothetical protein